jgi:hypothetical protein
MRADKKEQQPKMHLPYLLIVHDKNVNQFYQYMQKQVVESIIISFICECDLWRSTIATAAASA